jgi:hypothetical protein
MLKNDWHTQKFLIRMTIILLGIRIFFVDMKNIKARALWKMLFKQPNSPENKIK